MKLIEPKVELIQQTPGLVGMYKHIERCSRTCYKSEDKITEDSYKKMYDNLVQRGHLAMLEHGTVYLLDSVYSMHFSDLEKYENNKYSKVTVVINGDYTRYCVTTNYRVLYENNWLTDLNYICLEPTEFHERRITLKFTTNIGVTREGNRHRVNSIAEESTRYCNYNSNKFGNEISVCKPVWFVDEDIEYINKFDESEWIDYMLSIFDTRNPDFLNFNSLDWYAMSITFAQIAYRNLIRLGWSPQQAREVLPLATKSEVVYTAFTSDWKHWFDLRLIGATGKPHPNMEQIAELAQHELIKNNLWDLIYNPNKKEN